MAKRIAVSPNLEHISRFLEERGYRVVGINDNNYPIDAIVYSTQTNSNNITFTNESVELRNNNKFVLMINADEQSPQDILDMID